MGRYRDQDDFMTNPFRDFPVALIYDTGSESELSEIEYGSIEWNRMRRDINNEMESILIQKGSQFLIYGFSIQIVAQSISLVL